MKYIENSTDAIVYLFVLRLFAYCNTPCQGLIREFFGNDCNKFLSIEDGVVKLVTLEDQTIKMSKFY